MRVWWSMKTSPSWRWSRVTRMMPRQVPICIGLWLVQPLWMCVLSN